MRVLNELELLTDYYKKDDDIVCNCVDLQNYIASKNDTIRELSITLKRRDDEIYCLKRTIERLQDENRQLKMTANPTYRLNLRG